MNLKSKKQKTKKKKKKNKTNSYVFLHINGLKYFFLL